MFTNNELETILYTLEGYLQSTDDDKYGDELVRICDKIIQELPPTKVTNSDKVYPEVEDVPEQVYKEWLYNKDDNYGEKVDRLVDNMGMRKYKWDEQFYNEIVKDSTFSYGKFNEINYPIHLQQQ